MKPAYEAYLKQHLTPLRYQHSLGVMGIIADLAGIYELDRERAMAAGLLHDIAKDVPPGPMLTLAEQANITFTYPLERHPMYLHGPVGAHLAHADLGVDDPLILDAIRSHTDHAGADDAERARFFWCLRFADILAPVKSWPGMRKLRHTVFSGQHECAQLLLSTWVIEYFEAANIPVHPNFRHNAATLASHLQVEEDFYERW